MIEIVVHLVRGAYEASEASQATVEWPPHPARLFGALVDAADLNNDDHRRGLTVLEGAPPPHIVTSTWATAKAARTNYVVTNVIHKESKYGDIPLRIATGSRTWPRVMLAEPEIRFVWDLAAEIQLIDTLNVICKRIGYFGRSTSPAVVRCQPYSETSESDEGTERWRPIGGIGTPVRAISTGYLAFLEHAFERDMSAHEVPSTEIEYGLRDDLPKRIAPNAGYNETLAIKHFAKAVDSRRVLELTTLIRRAFLQRLSETLPPQQQPASLCGHANLGETTWKQVMFLALTNVGHEHADGTVKGLALIIPSDLDRQMRAHALNAWRAITELTLGSRGVAKLSDEPTNTWALQSIRWTKMSDRWTTVTPIVPARYCTSNVQRVRYVQEVCVAAGLPSPEVEIVSLPVQGALRLRADQTRRHPGSFGKPNFHAKLRFPEPITGPLCLGDMSHYGLGLCIPIKDSGPIAENAGSV
jgi:CRISPR-associated protein Csb2